MAPSGYDKQHLTSDGMVLRTLRWLPDGSKQEFGPDGKLLRVIESGVNIKKDKSDVIRYVLSTPDRVTTMRRIYDLCVQGYGFHTIAETFNSEGIPSPGGIKWNLRRAPSGSQRQWGVPVRSDYEGLEQLPLAFGDHAWNPGQGVLLADVFVSVGGQYATARGALDQA